MKQLSKIVGLCLAFVICFPAAANADAGSDDEYMMRVGDTISVTVWNHPEFTMPSVQIRPDGRIMHPYAGELQAAGKTPSGLAEQIRDILLQELKEPQVSVSIAKYRQDQIFVVGAVTRPGAIPIREPVTVQQTIALAGGLTEKADRSTARLITPAGQMKDIDLEAELEGKSAGEGIRLQPDYTLLVPERLPRKVAVFGAVKNPGIYQIPPEGMRLHAAVAEAGGLTDDAEAQAARFTRPDVETKTIDLEKIKQDVNAAENVSLSDGDAILIPRRELGAVSVLGEVRNPSVQQIESDKPLHISGAIAASGGTTERANSSRVTLMRDDGTMRHLDISGVLAGENSEHDLRLHDGDTVYIPPLKECVVFGAVSNPGEYPLKQGTTLFDILGASGGVRAGKRPGIARIARADGTMRVVDLPALLEQGRGGELNIPLREGDTVIVGKTVPSQVTILGEVKNPRRMALAEGGGERVSDIIARAGGLTARADTTKATVMRDDGSVVEIDLGGILQQQRPSANLQVAAGDTIVIDTKLRGYAAAVGAVQDAGIFQIRAGARVSDILAHAGGPAKAADAKHAVLKKRDATKITIDLEQVLGEEDKGANPEVENGDMLYVPSLNVGYAAVLGAVKKPGQYRVRRDEHLSGLISRAGGLPPEITISTATVMHGDGNIAEVDVQQVLDAPGGDADPVITDGDTVVVRKPAPVTVVGEVVNPGTYHVDTPTGISAVLAEAKGTLDTANLQRARIVRKEGGTTQVSIEEALRKPGSEADIAIEAGDTIIIQRVAPITIVGAVKAPGVYYLDAPVAVSRAVAKAEGTTDTADLQQARVIRSDGSRRRIDLHGLDDGKSEFSDVELTPGDLLMIPKAERYVSVVGAANKPGRFPIKKGDRLTDAIAMASGLKEERVRECTILRGGKEMTASLEKLEADSSQAANPLLKDGDTIILGRLQPARIAVIGQVEKEGYYPLETAGRLSEAIARAGGFTKEADPARVKLVRSGTRQIVDLSGWEGDSEEIPLNPPLQDEDLIAVPHTQHRVTVMGVVRKPGSYYFQPGDRLLAAVADAGGWIHGKSAPHRAALVRKQGDKVQWTKVNIFRGGVRGQPKNNPELKDDDVIYIPPVGKQLLDEIIDTIYPLARVIEWTED